MDPESLALLSSFLSGIGGQELLPKWLRVFALICWCALVLDVTGRKTVGPNVAAWLESREDSQEATDAIAAFAIRRVFDLVYALPLLLLGSRRNKQAQEKVLHDAKWTPIKAWAWALWPSMFLTVLATWGITSGMTGPTWGKDVSAAFWSGLIVNIFSDYLAVFVIRKWLVTTGQSWRQAMTFAVGAGLLLVTSFAVLRLAAFFLISDLFVGPCYPFFDDRSAFCQPSPLSVGVSYLASWDRDAMWPMLGKLFLLHGPGVLAAWAVHLWLPAFVGCVFILRAVNRLAPDVMDRIEEWTLGRHPILAIGVVAGAMTVMLFFWLPDVLTLLANALDARPLQQADIEL
jgi:hypothetical protein